MAKAKLKSQETLSDDEARARMVAQAAADETGGEDTKPVEVSATAPPPTKPDPFDPATLRIDPTSIISAGPAELITRIGIDKPGKQDYVRVHPNEAEFAVSTRVIQFKEDGDTYLIQPHLHGLLYAESVPVFLYTAMKYPNAVFVWPVRMAEQGEKDMLWWSSARDGVNEAMKHWTRLIPDKRSGKYKIYPDRDNQMPAPEWPPLSFREILAIAFRDYNIDSADHPIVKRLLGKL
jgi:hypothetical protein